MPASRTRHQHGLPHKPFHTKNGCGTTTTATHKYSQASTPAGLTVPRYSALNKVRRTHDPGGFAARLVGDSFYYQRSGKTAASSRAAEHQSQLHPATTRRVVSARAGPAMSRWAHRRLPVNSFKKSAAVMAPPTFPRLT